MDAASGTNGSKIAVSPAIAETTGQLAATHLDDLSHQDATFLTVMGFDSNASSESNVGAFRNCVWVYGVDGGSKWV